MRKTILFGLMILFLSIAIPAMAVPPPPAPPGVRVTVPLPPPIVLPAPPEVVVLPETEVYVAPNVQEEIFFHNGYWWRPWKGRWYRSQYYDRGWGVYGGVPVWYNGIPRSWRNDYRNHLWGGHPWNYHDIHHSDLQKNWRTWHNTHYWDRPEHREFTHHHDGRMYGGGQKTFKKGAAGTKSGQATTGQHTKGQTTTGQHAKGQTNTGHHSTGTEGKK